MLKWKANIDGVIDGIANGMWCHSPAKHKKNYYLFFQDSVHSVKISRINLQLLFFAECHICGSTVSYSDSELIYRINLHTYHPATLLSSAVKFGPATSLV